MLLVMFTSNPNLMGEFVNSLWLKLIVGIVMIIIVGLNIWL
jgi:manganese transport protein